MSGKAKGEPAKGDLEMGKVVDDEEEFLRNPSIGELTHPNPNPNPSPSPNPNQVTSST